MPIGKWIGNWFGKWFGKSSDDTLQGHGVVSSTTWTATLDVVVRTIDAVSPAPTSQGTGPAITSKYSDPDAYRHDRVSQRFKSVVIAGREYDPFDPTLIDRLTEYAATPEPEHDDELQRQSKKLARSVTVNTENKSISIPVFRPMLAKIPDFKASTADDLEKYAEQAGIAAQDEYRRIVLLLLSADA